MYSEKSFKNYIFWLQVKRIFLMVVLSIIGSGLGVLIGKILESTIQMTTFNNVIIAVSTIIFFLISLLLTSGTGKQVQDAYWKIAVLRKLTVIQKDLEVNNELLKNSTKLHKVERVVHREKIENVEKKDEEKVETDKEKSLTVQGPKGLKKVSKQKAPQEVSEPLEKVENV